MKSQPQEEKNYKTCITCNKSFLPYKTKCHICNGEGIHPFYEKDCPFCRKGFIIESNICPSCKEDIDEILH